MGAREVGPWVGGQKPLGKTPLWGSPRPEMTHLPTFRVGSIYTFAVWCNLEGKWVVQKWGRSPKSDKKLYKRYKKRLDCTKAKGCVSEPLLHTEERFKFVLLSILHLVIRAGDYVTKFVRKKCKDLPPATRDCVQDHLNCSKTKTSLKGHDSPDGELTWLLLANWRHIGKVMKLPNHVIDVVVQIASLITALQSWEFTSNALNCKSTGKKSKGQYFPPFNHLICYGCNMMLPGVWKNCISGVAVCSAATLSSR